MLKRVLSIIICAVMLMGTIPIALPHSTASAATASPVIYLKMSTGSDSNAGTFSAPVKTLMAAFEKLAATGAGGTVVLMDGVNNRSGNTATLQTLPDAGGTVTITANYGGVNYQSTNNARLMLYDGLVFQNDVVFDYVTFLKVNASATRAIYMQHNDLTVKDTCNVYTYSGTFAVGTCPAKSALVESGGTMVIVTGYKSASGTSAVNFGIQKVLLDGGMFGRIFAGNKAFVSESSGATEQTSADSGEVWVRIGENAGVNAFIDALQAMVT